MSVNSTLQPPPHLVWVHCICMAPLDGQQGHHLWMGDETGMKGP